ncbi:MAG: class I SAM-dependent methyltransferase [Rickettsiales bacterium]
MNVEGVRLNECTDRPFLSLALRNGTLVSRLDPFDKPSFQRRLRNVSQKEAFARALGLKSSAPKTVFDMCGGTGADAVLMAEFGARVTCCEKHPVVATLLAHTLAAMREREEDAETASRIALFVGDARECAEPEAFDAAHIDAMFLKNGAALAHKDMRLLQELTEGEPDESQSLLACALAKAPRVAVKRAASSSPLAPPCFSIEGKAVRYDVYVRRNARIFESG